VFERFLKFSRSYAQTYPLALSVALLLKPVANSKMTSFHATFASFAIFMAYAYRDLWPLITFTLNPADGHEGALLWTKVAAAAVAGLIVPFCEPYPYVPVDPEVAPFYWAQWNDC
jgi:hypothetical protein